MVLEDRDGIWIEQQDMLSKYLRRPKELEMISAAQFSKCYTNFSRKIKEEDAENEENDEEHEIDTDDANGSFANYLIT